MPILSQKSWDNFKKIVNEFNELDIGKQTFIWLRKVDQMPAWGEDPPNVYEAVTLQALFHYNYVRTWPYTLTSDSGQVEAENQVMYIAKSYLEKKGYLNSHGYWDLNWAGDRFIVNGQVFKPSGDTLVSQARDEALLFFLILAKLSPEESKEILEEYYP